MLLKYIAFLFIFIPIISMGQTRISITPVYCERKNQKVPCPKHLQSILNQVLPVIYAIESRRFNCKKGRKVSVILKIEVKNGETFHKQHSDDNNAEFILANKTTRFQSERILSADTYGLRIIDHSCSNPKVEFSE